MDEVPKAAYDASARLEYMDRVGIWAMALYPNVGGFVTSRFSARVAASLPRLLTLRKPSLPYYYWLRT